MTTHTAALHESIASEIQRDGAVSHAILGVALLATRLRVFFLEHGPQPETILPMAFQLTRSRAAVAPVTTRTAKLLRIVDCENLFVRMADERARQAVGFAAWLVRRETRRRQLQRLANAGMTNLATVDDVVSVHADLMAEDRVVILGHLRFQTVDCRRR